MYLSCEEMNDAFLKTSISSSLKCSLTVVWFNAPKVDGVAS